MSQQLTEQEKGELKLAVSDYMRDRNGIIQQLSIVSLIGSLGGFAIGKSLGDVLKSSSSPSFTTSSSSSSRMIRRSGPAPLRLGVLGALMGGGLAAAYITKENDYEEQLDPTYLVGYGASRGLIASLTNVWKLLPTKPGGEQKA